MLSVGSGRGLLANLGLGPQWFLAGTGSIINYNIGWLGRKQPFQKAIAMYLKTLQLSTTPPNELENSHILVDRILHTHN